MAGVEIHVFVVPATNLSPAKAGGRAKRSLVCIVGVLQLGFYGRRAWLSGGSGRDKGSMRSDTACIEEADVG